MEKQQITVNKNGEGQRLDVFLSSIFNESTRSHLNNMIKNGYVLLNDKLVKSGIKLKIGDVISVSNYETKKLDLSPEDIDIDIVYEDDDLAVVNKPQGIKSHPNQPYETGTLMNYIAGYLDVKDEEKWSVFLSDANEEDLKEKSNKVIEAIKNKTEIEFYDLKMPRNLELLFLSVFLH